MIRPPIHPGEILADQLDELGLSANQLGRHLYIPTNRITQIIGGKRGITADTALPLGRKFGTGPELWLNLKKSYVLRLAENEAGSELRRTIAPRPFAEIPTGSLSV